MSEDETKRMGTSERMRASEGTKGDRRRGQRMGADPLEGLEEDRSYPQTVITPRDAPGPPPPAEAQPLEGGRRARRKWVPRSKSPDDPHDRTRHSYYIGDWIHSRLKVLAREHHVPVSDLARYLLREGIQRLEEGGLELEVLETVVKKLP